MLVIGDKTREGYFIGKQNCCMGEHWGDGSGEMDRREVTLEQPGDSVTDEPQEIGVAKRVVV